MMRLLLIHPDADVLRNLCAALTGTGDYTLEIAATPDEARALLVEDFDLALLWIDLFAVKGGIALLQGFLKAIAPARPVLIVPPAMRALSDKISGLDVLDTWVMPDTLPESLRQRIAEYARRVPDKPIQQPTPKLPVTDALPNRLPPPRAAKRSVGAAPVPSGWSVNGTRILGVWSASGGAGVTTVAAALARVSGRALVSLSEPGLSLALGAPDAAPWRPLSANGFALYLAPSLFSASAEDIVSAAREHIAPLPGVILDLPTGASTVALELIPTLDCLLYVLPPDKASVALAVHALSGLQVRALVLAWNRCAPGEVAQAEAGLRLLSMTPVAAGQLDEVSQVRQARNRNQTLLDAAEDGVALGNLPTQLRTLAAALYSDLKAPAQTNGKGRFRLEIVE